MDINFSFKPYLHHRVDKRTRLSKIYIQVIVGKVNVYLDTGAAVDPVYWIKEKGEIDRQFPNAKDLNLIIKRAMGKVNDIAIRYRLKHFPITPEILKKEYKSEYNMEDFLGFFKDHMWNEVRPMQSRTGYTNYLAAYNKLKKCFKTLHFHELDHDFILRFDKYMANIDKNSPNTRSKYHSKVKAVINVAIKKGYDIPNPYRNFKIRKFQTRPVHLSQKELKELVNLFWSGDLEGSTRETLRAFLFSCFTSLRLSDIRAFEISWIYENKIELTPKKTSYTGKRIAIPLNKTARQYLDMEKQGAQFDLVTDQQMNKKLKDIGKAKELRKSLTFHVARHTYATTFLELGGKIEVLKEILGHSSINETMIYAHITDHQMDDQASNFDGKFN